MDGGVELAAAGLEDGYRDEVWLLGQPPLRSYLDFVREKVAGGENADPRAICDEWREANDRYHDLEEAEAGVADEVGFRDLPSALRPLAREVEADPYFRRTFDSLPTRFGLVELDRLVVYQPHVTCSFVEALKSRLGPRPSPEALFRFCLPLRRGDAPMRITKTGSRRYVFESESTDLRFHETTLLTGDQIGGYGSFGPIGGVVGLVVGYGSNFLNVIEADDRMLLHNGYHRAYALREMGVTHAPCVVQTVTRRDELDLVATRSVVEEPEFYFRAPRPPLLKDFFDPKIRKVLRVRRMRKLIEVNFEIREFDVAD